MQHGGFGTAVCSRDPDQNVIGAALCVFDEHIEITTVIEDSRVCDLELRILLPASPVLLNQGGVWKLGLRAFIESLLVRMRRGCIQIEVALLHIFAVVPLAVRESKEAFFENGIFAVPESRGKSEAAFPVAKAEKAILTPAVCAAARVIVRKVFPTSSVWGVILAHGGPLAFG